MSFIIQTKSPTSEWRDREVDYEDKMAAEDKFIRLRAGFDPRFQLRVIDSETGMVVYGPL